MLYVLEDVVERYSAYLSDDGYMQFGGHDTQSCSRVCLAEECSKPLLAHNDRASSFILRYTLQTLYYVILSYTFLHYVPLCYTILYHFRLCYTFFYGSYIGIITVHRLGITMKQYNGMVVLARPHSLSVEALCVGSEATVQREGVGTSSTNGIRGERW